MTGAPTDPWLPADEALAGLTIVRRAIAAGDGAALGVDGAIDRVDVLRHHPGRRLTVRVHTGDGTTAIVKLFAKGARKVHLVLDAVAGVDLPGVRAPRVLAFDPDADLLVTDAFTGPTLLEAAAGGDGARIGALASAWLTAGGRRHVRVGRTYRPEDSLARIANRAASFPDRTPAARVERLVARLAATLPPDGPTVLMHGSFRPTHLFDGGDTIGIVDWDGYHQGPLEFDVGTFLATCARHAIERPELATALGHAEDVVRGRVSSMVDPARADFYEALALAKVAGKLGQLVPGSAAAVMEVVERAEWLVCGLERAA